MWLASLYEAMEYKGDGDIDKLWIMSIKPVVVVHVIDWRGRGQRSAIKVCPISDLGVPIPFKDFSKAGSYTT